MHVSQKKGVGFLTYALNTDVDYEKCALLWALSLRASHKNTIQIAVVVNDSQSCRSELHDVCNHVITVPQRTVVNNMQYEADLLNITPFKETIKMECDMLVPCDMTVWMHTLRNQDLYFTGHVIDHHLRTADDSRYRKFIHSNKLPNVYNGLYYARITKRTYKFFQELDRIFVNWHEEITKYRMWERHEPSTDFAIAMALNNMDWQDAVSNTHLPTFVHNKKHCVGKWRYHTVVDPTTIIVNGAKIDYPWHYHDKSLATEHLISKYTQYV